MPSNSRFANNSQNASTAQRKCWRCAGDHRADDCRHKLEKCPKCKFPGHIASQCESVQQWRRKFARKPIQRKQIGSLSVGMATKNINATSLLKVGILVNKKKTKFAADSGTEVNIIDEDAYDQIGRPKIEKCEEKGQLFNGSKVAFIGKGVATFQFGDVAIDQEFYVAKRGSLNLLSISTMDAFGLLDDLKRKISNSAINLCGNTNSRAPFTSEAAEKFIRELKATFSNTFEEGLGLCTKELAHLQLKDGATPIYRKARPVPHHSKEIIDKELDRLEQLGIIRKAEHLSWAAPILVVKKSDGSARLCIDYSTGLNDALLDFQHPLPIPDDIFATLNGGKFFSQIDLKDAYFQIQLDDDSKTICGISTHKGNYFMERLPFGVKSAPGIFQSIMDKMLAGLNFAFRE